MIRFLTFLGTIILFLMGGFLFHVKYQVVGIEVELKKVKQKITEVQEAIHVLKAEWSYLNKPERLQKLAARYLPDIGPPDATQMVRVLHPFEEGDAP